MASCYAYKKKKSWVFNGIELLASKTNLISEGECGTSNLIGTSAFMFGISSKKEKETNRQTRPMPGADTGEELPRVTGCYADLEVRSVF